MMYGNYTNNDSTRTDEPNYDNQHITTLQPYQLPEEVRSVANLMAGSRVVAWTKVDDEANLGTWLYCTSIGVVLVCLPCFWLQVLMMSTCLCSILTASINGVLNQYWILTETELKIVTMDHDTCCIPGCASSGNQIKSIPLENITDCEIHHTTGKGCLNQCVKKDFPVIYIDTASSGPNVKEATGIALVQSAEFAQKILQQRDIVKNGTTPVNISYYPMEDRDGPVAITGNNKGNNNNTKSAVDRILEAKSLLEKGIITQEEFDDKHKSIIELV